MKQLLLILSFTFIQSVFAQSDSSGSLSFSGYVEVYYGYDVNQTPNNERPHFLYNYRKSNEVSVNLAFLKAAYTTQRVRGNLALLTGSYAQYNMASEPVALRNIFEANIGVKLGTQKNIWVDAGVLPSHLGLTSPIGKNWTTLTRSITCENTPYYETGVRLQYITDNNKWLMALYVINGWQHIQRPNASKIPALGTQITFTPSKKLSINYSTFLGNEFPDSAKRIRFFNNVFATYEVNSTFGFATGMDLGMQQKASQSSFHFWNTAFFQARYKITPKWFVAGRFEYYRDPHEIIIQYNTPNGFQTRGYSVNIDYNITDNAMWRIEGRMFNSKDQIFTDNNSPTDRYVAFTTSLAIAF